MNKLILLLIVFTHALAFAGHTLVSSSALIAKIEITHSHHHEHSDEHHHKHEEFNLDLKNIHSDVPNEEHTHRQDVIVNGQTPYISTDCQIHLFKPVSLITYLNFHQKLPPAPFRQGIFRPPISA